MFPGGGKVSKVDWKVERKRCPFDERLVERNCTRKGRSTIKRKNGEHQGGASISKGVTGTVPPVRTANAEIVGEIAGRIQREAPSGEDLKGQDRNSVSLRRAETASENRQFKKIAFVECAGHSKKGGKAMKRFRDGLEQAGDQASEMSIMLTRPVYLQPGCVTPR